MRIPILFGCCLLLVRAAVADVLEFGPVVVGHDSTASIEWGVPSGEPLSIQFDLPPAPFELLSYHADSLGARRWLFTVKFSPDSVGDFSGVIARVLDPNGNPTAYGLTVHGEGVLSAGARQRPGLFPSSFSLQASPNPFNPTTEVSFALPQAGRVSVKVFDILGKQAATLYDGIAAAGEHRVTFDGGQLPAGIYFLRLEAAAHQRTLKLVLLK
jgi:hypothetical protein